MSEDITKELCIGCGEYKPRGLLPSINHSCALNTFTYRVGKFGMRQLMSLFSKRDEMQSFKDLLVFPHFNAIEKSIHPLDEMLYLHARQFEIKQMKRVRAWIEIEEDFNSKY